MAKKLEISACICFIINKSKKYTLVVYHILDLKDTNVRTRTYTNKVIVYLRRLSPVRIKEK